VNQQHCCSNSSTAIVKPAYLVPASIHTVSFKNPWLSINKVNLTGLGTSCIVSASIRTPHRYPYLRSKSINQERLITAVNNMQSQTGASSSHFDKQKWFQALYGAQVNIAYRGRNSPTTWAWRNDRWAMQDALHEIFGAGMHVGIRSSNELPKCSRWEVHSR